MTLVKMITLILYITSLFYKLLYTSTSSNGFIASVHLSPTHFLFPTNNAQYQRFTRRQFLHLTILARNHLLQRLRRSSQRSKRPEMHRNHRLGVQQKLHPSLPSLSSYVIHSVGGFFRSHRIEIADTEQRNVRSVDVINDLHIAERSGVSAVIDMMIFKISTNQ